MCLMYCAWTNLIAEEHVSSGTLLRWDILSFLDNRLSFFLQNAHIIVIAKKVSASVIYGKTVTLG